MIETPPGFADNFDRVQYTVVILQLLARLTAAADTDYQLLGLLDDFGRPLTSVKLNHSLEFEVSQRRSCKGVTTDDSGSG